MSQEKTRSRAHDLLGAVLGTFCTVMLVLAPWQIDLDVSYPFYKGPFIMPILALSIGVIASLPSWYRLLFKGKGRSWELDGAGAPRKPFLMLVTALFYPIGIFVIGLEIATFLILAVELYITGQRNRKILFFIPLLLSGIFWLVFRRMLDVYFPEPLLFYVLG
ncbi:MAG: tripartite tricarboxylate transporter TctB family protein [Mailhella sp.]|nr:tripartite tricarboxylate transporter TctB family protein [Mailhella sp.]